MVPTSSISKMFDIIRNENMVSLYSTEQLKEILYILQNEDLTRLRDVEGLPLFPCFTGIISPVFNLVDMEKIIKLEEKLIKELQERGENPSTKKFS